MCTRKLMMLFLIATIISGSGCALTLTMTGPEVEEVRLGEKSQSEAVSYNYILEEEKNVFELKKQPLCKEMAQEIIVTRKRMRGFIPAIIEIPLYGLGIGDLVLAGVYSKASEEERDGDVKKTGRILTCGTFEPAGNEEIIIQFPDSERVKHLKTDADGKLNLGDVIPKSKRDLHINVFVKEKGGVAFIRTLDETRWY